MSTAWQAPGQPPTGCHRVLRHGPAFWRRSVQARVVVSTRAALGCWSSGSSAAFLIQQTRDGLARPPGRRGGAEAEGETEAARASAAPPTPGIEVDESAQQQDAGRADHQRGGPRAASPWSCRRRSASGGRLADGGAKFTAGPRPGQRAGDPRGSASTTRLADGLDLHRHPHHADDPRAARGPRHRGRQPGAGCRPTTTPTRSTTSTRSTRSSETLALVVARDADRRRPAAAARRRADVAGRPGRS